MNYTYVCILSKSVFGHNIFLILYKRLKSLRITGEFSIFFLLASSCFCFLSNLWTGKYSMLFLTNIFWNVIKFLKKTSLILFLLVLFSTWFRFLNYRAFWLHSFIPRISIKIYIIFNLFYSISFNALKLWITLNKLVSKT